MCGNALEQEQGGRSEGIVPTLDGVDIVKTHQPWETSLARSFC
jgi:hypothetical protein